MDLIMQKEAMTKLASVLTEEAEVAEAYNIVRCLQCI